MAISRPRVLAIAQRKYYLLVEVPMHIMHTAATTRPYLSRRQKPTCSHVARSVSQVGFDDGRTLDGHNDQQN